MIAIYRACNTEMAPSELKTERPAWFDKKKCFDSFYRSWVSVKSSEEIYVVFDGDPNSELASYIKSFSIGKFISIDYRNNGLSLLACYELAAKENFDFVYFVEDDYLHTKDAIEVLISGLESFSGAMFTLYDHPDRYTRTDDITRNQETILLNSYCHWRTAESTTCTVAMSKEVFNHIHKDMMMFTNDDRPMYRYLLQKYGARLITPIPGKSTHVNKFFMSPLVDWAAENVSSTKSMDWTFGICFGGNVAHLTQVIESIEKQNIKNYEILIAYEEDCPEDLKHKKCTWLKTGIGKKGWLSKKKNDIIKSAKYNNICLLHDYLILDNDWYQGFNLFGENWSTCSSKTLDPFRGRARIADWLTIDHPIYGLCLLPYNMNESKYQFLSGMYFCVKKDFIIKNNLFFDEELTWFSGMTGGQFDDQEWSKRVRLISDFSFNKNSTVLSLKPKYIELKELRMSQ